MMQNFLLDDTKVVRNVLMSTVDLNYTGKGVVNVKMVVQRTQLTVADWTRRLGCTGVCNQIYSCLPWHFGKVLGCNVLEYQAESCLHCRYSLSSTFKPKRFSKRWIHLHDINQARAKEVKVRADH